MEMTLEQFKAQFPDCHIEPLKGTVHLMAFYRDTEQRKALFSLSDYCVNGHYSGPQIGLTPKTQSNAN